MNFIFYNSFRFPAKLNKRNIFATYFRQPTYAQLFPLTISHARMVHLYYPEVHSLHSLFMGSFFMADVQWVLTNICIRCTCINHCSVLQSIFTVLNFPYALPFHSSLSKLWKPLILSVSPQFFLFQGVIQLESCSMQPFQIGSFTQQYTLKFPSCLFMV